jgi:hypothetical protein
VEYWLGFSSLLPADWYYAENGDSLIYNFQLHGKSLRTSGPMCVSRRFTLACTTLVHMWFAQVV